MDEDADGSRGDDIKDDGETMNIIYLQSKRQSFCLAILLFGTFSTQNHNYVITHGPVFMHVRINNTNAIQLTISTFTPF